MEDIRILVRLCECFVQFLFELNQINRKSIWVNDLFFKRQNYGACRALVPEILKNERITLRQFIRMDVDQFDYIKGLLIDRLQKHSPFRVCLSVEEKLIVTLRFLATGESYSSLSFYFLMAKSSISTVVKEVCQAINKIIGPIHCALPDTREKWFEIADKFSEKWNFPFVVGSIDGKHIVIQKPANSWSKFINYKGQFSFVLLAIVDADNRFIGVDIGCNGRISDGGVWLRSKLKKLFTDLNNPLNIPPGYCLIGDPAFPLGPTLMTPFGGRNLTRSQMIFNYRLSRARLTVEDAFGILTSRFRVLSRRMLLSLENAKIVTLSCVVLHNLLRSQSISNSANNNSLSARGVSLLDLDDSNSPELAGIAIGNNLTNYFSSTGSVSFQERIFDLDIID